MNHVGNRVSQKSLLRLILGGITVCLCILFGPDSVALAASPDAIGNAYTWLTISMAIAGTIIFVLYLNAMFTVLKEAASSYSIVEEDNDHIFYYAAPVLGALAAGITAALVIWSYGMNPVFLYLGPILCLISPVAIIYCMSRDIKGFKESHIDSSLPVDDTLAPTVER